MCRGERGIRPGESTRLMLWRGAAAILSEWLISREVMQMLGDVRLCCSFQSRRLAMGVIHHVVMRMVLGSRARL